MGIEQLPNEKRNLCVDVRLTPEEKGILEEIMRKCVRTYNGENHAIYNLDDNWDRVYITADEIRQLNQIGQRYITGEAVEVDGVSVRSGYINYSACVTADERDRIVEKQDTFTVKTDAPISG